MVMYNAMIHPLIRYTVRGFIWYQGESNVGHHDVYADRLCQTWSTFWRKDWGLGDLPFYLCLKFGFPGFMVTVKAGTSGRCLREAQFQSHNF